MSQSDNSVVFKLKGVGVICPIPNLSLNDILECKGLVCNGEQVVGVCDEFLKCVRVHLKNGVTLTFWAWYECDTDFVDEPLVGFSGPEHIRIKIFLKKSECL